MRNFEFEKGDAMAIKPIPDGFHSITPYLIVDGAARAIEFYKKAFGATERYRLPDPSGDRIGHAEIQIGDSIVMLADESPAMKAEGPHALGGSPISILLYVSNVDEVVDRAVAAGATITRPIQNQFYGDRSGGLEDPFGHKWFVASHVEEVSPEEMQKRYAALVEGAPSKTG